MSKISVTKITRPSTSVQWPWEANTGPSALATNYVQKGLAHRPVVEISNDGLEATVTVEFIDESTYQACKVDVDIIENRKTTKTYCDNNGISFMAVS
jgi:hypothetical protein